MYRHRNWNFPVLTIHFTASLILASLFIQTASVDEVLAKITIEKNPAVSSDLVLTVRFGRDPGTANGRPLKHTGNIFWSIDDDYLRGQEDKPSDR